MRSLVWCILTKYLLRLRMNKRYFGVEYLFFHVKYKLRRTYMVEIKELTKIYKLSKRQMAKLKTKDSKKTAVDHVSFTAREGEIFCLLGPNGAGKTTTLRCIATLLDPTEGQVLVEGFDTVKQGPDVRANIAFLTNEVKLDPNFTPDYLFTFFGKLRGMTEKQIKARKDELFSYFGIAEFENKKISELSTGMKQKASIAVSLIHDPKVVIFDEPTNGLDIITARAVTDYLKMLKDQGKIVIVSTHIMSEAQKLADRIAMIINGKCAFLGLLSEALADTKAEDLEDAFFEIYKRTAVEADVPDENQKGV